MSATAHTFTPRNQSFDERIRSCKKVLESYRNADVSVQHFDQKEWTDRLGTKEEIEFAKSVAENGMRQAIASIELSELHYAKEQGLLSSEEVMQLIDLKDKEFSFKPDGPFSKDDDFDGPDF